MKVVNTKTTNCTLKGNGRDIYDIPVTRIQFQNCVGYESCWELSLEEMDKLAQTGRLYVTVVGTPPSPIALSVEPEEIDEID